MSMQIGNFYQIMLNSTKKKKFGHFRLISVDGFLPTIKKKIGWLLAICI